MTPISKRAAAELRYKAATDPLRGRITSRLEAEWDVSGRCTSPRHVHLVGERDALGRPGYGTHLEVRCRSCEGCRAERRSSWTARMRQEIQLSPRTWFITLTMRPDAHTRYRAAARAYYAKQAAIISPSAVLMHEQKLVMAHQVRLELAEVVKYLKRVRKGGLYRHERPVAVVEDGKTVLKENILRQESTRIRYCVVVEHHKSGEPHYHLLLHEQSGFASLSRRWLAHQWPHGYGVWKIANLRNAGYIAKYVAKESSSRIRASRLYGQNALTAEHLGRRGPTQVGSGDVP